MSETLFGETREHILSMIREMLAAGKDKLPTEKDLAAQVTASYGTVRLVMKQLAEDGYVRKVAGSGTYLKPAAAELLRREAWQTLWLFSPPYIGHAESDYGAWLVESLKDGALHHGWKVQHLYVRSHDEFIAAMRRTVTPREAVVYLPPTEPFSPRQLGEFAHFEQQPVVIVDMELNNVSLCNIASDNRYGGMVAARQLLASGCRRLLILLCEPYLRNLDARVRGFTETAELYGVKPELVDCHVKPTDNRELLTYRHTMARLRSGAHPDGIFAVSDSGAIGAFRALRELGLTPGQDINLVGFDGLAIGGKLNPPLATVIQPVAEITAAVFDTLRDWRPGLHTQQLLSPSFYAGGSIGQRTGMNKLAAVI